MRRERPEALAAEKDLATMTTGNSMMGERR